MTPRQVFGTVGALMILAGPFLPFVAVPIIGSVSYMEVATGEALIILAAGATAAALIASGRHKFVPHLGIVALVVVLSALVRYEIGRDEYQRRQHFSKRDGFSTLAQRTMGIGRLSWGVGVLIVGPVLLVASNITSIGSGTSGRRKEEEIDET